MHHRTARLRPLALAALGLAVAVGGVACSSDSGDDSSGDTTTTAVKLATWSEKVNDLCLASKGKLDKLEAPADDSDFTTIASSGKDAKQIIEEFVTKVKAVGTPAEKAVTARKFVTAFSSYADALDAQVVARLAAEAQRLNAESGDPTKPV